MVRFVFVEHDDISMVDHRRLMNLLFLHFSYSRLFQTWSTLHFAHGFSVAKSRGGSERIF